METIEQITETDYEKFEKLLELKLKFVVIVHTGNYEEKKILPRYVRQINLIFNKLSSKTINNYILQYTTKSINERRRICS